MTNIESKEKLMTRLLRVPVLIKALLPMALLMCLSSVNAPGAQALVQHHYGGTLLQPAQRSCWNFCFGSTHLTGNIAAYEGSGEVKVCEYVRDETTGATQKSCGINAVGNALNVESWLGDYLVAEVENASSHAHTIHGYAYEDIAYMWAGEYRYEGQELQSRNGRYRFLVQSDGNAVVSNTSTGKTCWSTNTSGYPYEVHMEMESNGNFTLFGWYQETPPYWKSLWSSGTSGHSGAYAKMQDDGNLVVYYGGSALWASNSAGC